MSDFEIITFESRCVKLLNDVLKIKESMCCCDPNGEGGKCDSCLICEKIEQHLK